MSSEEKNTDPPANEFASALSDHEGRVRTLIELHMPPLLKKRLSVDDVLQEVSLAGLQRLEHWQAYQHIPTFVRLRTLTLQTITDCCRRHLGAAKRDCGREVALNAASQSSDDMPLERWLVQSATSPLSRLAKAERLAAVRTALGKLSATDQEILTLRHIEDLSNQEVAHTLGIEIKAASIRYVRALKRLQDLLRDLTGIAK